MNNVFGSVDKSNIIMFVYELRCSALKIADHLECHRTIVLFVREVKLRERDTLYTVRLQYM